MSPTALWYLTRGTGAVTLILLTLSVALGVANVRRARTGTVPRFVFEAVHRNAALLAMAILVVHIATSLLDGFAPIRLIDVIVPFHSAYRPLWLGFGALAFDLLVAVAITSVLRRHLGYRAWRATHWVAYASWPVALLHGLGTGSDTKTTWMLGLTGACVIVVIVAVTARATAGWPEHLGARASAIAASALVPLGLLVWLPSGPLAAGWAKRAGTPNSLLHATAAGAPAAARRAARGAVSGFSARLRGTVDEFQLGGLEEVSISLAVSGRQLSALRIRINGQPLGGGGVAMTSSTVTLGTESDLARYRGTVTALDGTSIRAGLSDSHGTRIDVLARLRMEAGNGRADGTLTVQPGRRR